MTADNLLESDLAFRRNRDNWFADSTVVDGDGLPLPVYHSADHSLSQYNFLRGTYGVFFTPDPAKATKLGRPGSAVWLCLNNPLSVSYRDFQTGAHLSREQAIGQGHDGFVIHEKSGAVSYLVFSRFQVKSATANSGCFDPSNLSIFG